MNSSDHISSLNHWIPGSSRHFLLSERQFYTKHLHKNKLLKRTRIYKTATFEERKISITGMAEILNNSNSLRKRVFWLIILLVFSILCCYQLGLCFKLYFEFPTYLQTEILDGRKVSFPAIYICPGMFQNLQRIFYKLNKCPKTYGSCPITDPYDRVRVQNFPRLNSNPPIAIQELWSLIAVKSSDLSLFIPCGADVLEGRCSLLGKELHIPNTSIATFWGSCLVLESSPDIDYLGPLTYLKILHRNRFHQNVIEKLNKEKIETNQTQLIKAIEATLQHPKVAFLISMFHEDRKNRQHYLFYQSFEALQGYEMHAQLQRKQFQYLNKKSNPCFSEDEWLECYNNCIEKFMSKECSVPYYTQTHLPRTCLWDNTFIALQLNNIEAYNKFSVTNCSCPRVCENTIYVTTLNVIEKLYNQSNTLVKIHFADQTFERTVEKYFYTFTSLLSDIGGNLGFFLGFSILTILELIESMFSFVTKRILQM